MRSFEDRPNAVDDAAIDRLVDGELSEIERRDLLLQLENDPEGWRRCALSFLEDQAWRLALARSAAPIMSSGPLEMPPSSLRIGKRRPRRFAIAASLLALTFAAGFAAGGMSRPIPAIEIARPDVSKATEAGQVEGSTTPGNQIREVGRIDLVDGSGGETPLQQIPIFSGPGLNDQWLENQPSSVPSYVKARWERQGYQVAERRKVMSVILEDGRRVSLPVDEVKLDYVGQKPL